MGPEHDSVPVLLQPGDTWHQGCPRLQGLPQAGPHQGGHSQRQEPAHQHQQSTREHLTSRDLPCSTVLCLYTSLKNACFKNGPLSPGFQTSHKHELCVNEHVSFVWYSDDWRYRDQNFGWKTHLTFSSRGWDHCHRPDNSSAFAFSGQVGVKNWSFSVNIFLLVESIISATKKLNRKSPLSMNDCFL